MEEVKNWPIPKTTLDMLAFLGLAGFERRFVHKFAEVARPLTDFLKSTEFEESVTETDEKRL